MNLAAISMFWNGPFLYVLYDPIAYRVPSNNSKPETPVGARRVSQDLC